MTKCFSFISDHLLILVGFVTVFSLIFPRYGSYISELSMPLLAVMVLNVSMTIRIDDLKIIKKYPFLIVWCAFLQFVTTSLFSFVITKLILHGNLGTGQILLGCLPADISAPLMVSLVGGSTALATAMLVLQMILTPVILPLSVSFYTHMDFKMPFSYLVFELAVVILLPTFIGILMNWKFPRLEKQQTVLTGISSLCYLGLLWIVVSSNSHGLLALGTFIFALLAVEIALNLFGYLSAYITGRVLKNKDVAYSSLFILGSKEFGISIATSNAMGLNAFVMIPSAFYAIIQMVSMPIVVKIIKQFKQNEITKMQ